MKLLAQVLTIKAPASVVFAMFTDPAQFVRWMADEAHLDPRPSGEIRWTHANGDSCSGSYVELVADRRVVFTYGWERSDVGIPPGSTTVEVDLWPDADGNTVLKLVHRGLDTAGTTVHHGGWVHFLGRLRSLAEGHHPGPDSFVERRVPSRKERELL